MAIENIIDEDLLEQEHLFNKFKVTGTINLTYQGKPLECQFAELIINHKADNNEIINVKNEIINVKLKVQPSAKDIDIFKRFYPKYTKLITEKRFLEFKMKKHNFVCISNIDLINASFNDYILKSEGKIFILDNYEIIGVST